MMIRRSAALLFVLTAFCPAAMSDTQELLRMAAKATDGAVAVLSFKVAGELAPQTVTGLAFCIAPSGLFMSTALDVRMRPEDLSDFELTVPGQGGTKVKARLVGIDPETGIGFLRPEGNQQWKAIEAAETPDLRVGQGVASAGLLPEDTGHAKYFGAGYVSAVVRVPEKQVYVTGGVLTVVGSPVLNEEGRLVGLVLRQLPMRRQFLPTDRGAVPIQTSGERESSFFMPIDELKPVIDNAGKERKLSWIGAVEFKPVEEGLAKTRKLDKPGVMLDSIVPDSPAGKARLRNLDVIVGINGRPVEELGMPTLTAQNLNRFLMRLPPGTPLRLNIFRSENEVFEVSLKTAEFPKWTHQAERYYSPDLGFGIRERLMIDDYLKGGPEAKGPGVIVYAVRRDGPAHTAGMNNNDLVVSMGGIPVTTVEAFRDAEKKVLADKSLRLVEVVVMRGELKETLKLQLGDR